MRYQSVVLLFLTAWALAGCSPAGRESQVLGEWVRDGHPDAWFITFGRDGAVTFGNETLNMEVTGSYTMADSTRIEITIDQPSRWLPESLAFSVAGWGRTTG